MTAASERPSSPSTESIFVYLDRQIEYGARSTRDAHICAEIKRRLSAPVLSEEQIETLNAAAQLCRDAASHVQDAATPGFERHYECWHTRALILRQLAESGRAK